MATTLKADNLEHNKKVWLKIYTENGVKELAKQVMNKEITVKLVAKRTLLQKDAEWTASTFAQCLLSTESAVLKSIVGGNLARDRRLDSSLAGTLDRLRIQSEYQPGIYLQQLVDYDGNSPSANELLKMADVMEGYVKGCRKPETQSVGSVINDELANKVDNLHRSSAKRVSKQQTETGYRRHMYTTPRSTTDDSWITVRNAAATNSFETYSKAHVLETRKFIFNLRRRTHAIRAEDRDKPLEYPLCEVGYSVRCIARLRQHASYSSSNYIMNLADAIFQSGQSGLSTKFAIRQFVIYLFWDVTQSELAEIGLAKLAESYTGNAGGFSHHVAGQSNHSSSHVNAREWNAATAYMLKQSSFRKNLKAQVVEMQQRVTGAERHDQDTLEKEEQDRLDAIKKAFEQTSLSTTPSSNAEFDRLKGMHIAVRWQWEKTVMKNATAVGDLAATVADFDEELGKCGHVGYHAGQVCEAWDNANIGSPRVEASEDVMGTE